ncbi:MAG: hypothetical protein ACFFBF_12570 [Promethearchaeota archaeon]
MVKEQFRKKGMTKNILIFLSYYFKNFKWTIFAVLNRSAILIILRIFLSQFGFNFIRAYIVYQLITLSLSDHLEIIFIGLPIPICQNGVFTPVFFALL